MGPKRLKINKVSIKESRIGQFFIKQYSLLDSDDWSWKNTILIKRLIAGLNLSEKLN